VTWTLAECRDRSKGSLSVGVHTKAELDRAQLLALLRRTYEYLDHKPACVVAGVWRKGDRCDCGLAELLRELGGDAK
jgi:hypothetical protein